MKTWNCTRAGIAIVLMSCGAASAQTVKVGIIYTYSGPLAPQGEQMERGIQLYMKQHESDLPEGVKIELIRRDDTGPIRKWPSGWRRN